MKIKYLILISLLFPINVLAYSEYIIPSGQSVGIEIQTDGILVVGFYKIDGKISRGNPEIRIGDKITHVENTKISTIKELISTIESKMRNNKVHVTVLRGNHSFDSELTLKYEDNTYKTGLYVKDSISGIGTLTYIDPKTKIYGALGHEIVETNTNQLVDVKTGSIFKSIITSIDRSYSGTPGGKNAKFYSSNKYGTIDKNGIRGIYGEYTSNIKTENAIKVANIDEVSTGKAYRYTVLDGEKVGEYEINITRVDTKSDIKNIYFDVVDKELLEKTGGIVQGMSGSPIVQNNKIVGAVTHVVVSNPSSGYGISIVHMLEEGEK